MKTIVSWLRRQGKRQQPAADGARDGLSRLPLELHFYILEHVEPEDFAAALNVCRSWRYIWLSDDVWSWYAVRRFPGLVEQISLTARTEHAMGTLFHKAIVKQQLRIHGCFSSALQNCLTLESDRLFRLMKNVPKEDGGIHAYSAVREPGPALDRFSRFRLYSKGRIAWWPEPYALPYIAVVDDLRSRSRRMYSFPDHHEEQAGYQAALGDKLFIMGKGQTLHVWHLESDTRQRVDLPYDFKRCVTEGDTVVVVAKDSTVYSWKFGSPFRQIDVSSIYSKAPVTWGDPGDFVPSALGPHRVGLWLRGANTAIDFIIHPTVEHVFFVVTLTGGILTVHEFKEDQNIGTHTLDDGLLSPRALAASGQLRWEKIDSRGGYNLLSIYPMPRGGHWANEELEEVCREISCRCQTWWRTGGHTLVSVCFNIYTRCFEVLRHQPLSYYNGKSFHIWNRKLFCAGRHHQPHNWHVASFKDYTGWNGAKAIADVPFYSISRPAKSRLGEPTRRRVPLDELELYGLDTQAEVFRDIDYFLDAKQLPTVRSRPDLDDVLQDNPRIVGDDDFMIFLEHEVYTAWYFAIPG